MDKTRELKFRYVLQHEETGIIMMRIFTLNQVGYIITGVDRHILIAQNQFTGLLDKHGKEIYEGDIVKTLVLGSSRIGEIIFDQGAFKMIGNYGSKSYKFKFYLTSKKEKENTILGNIYENPELLSKEEYNG